MTRIHFLTPLIALLNLFLAASHDSFVKVAEAIFPHEIMAFAQKQSQSDSKGVKK